MLYNLLKTGAGNKDWEYFSIDAVSGLIQTAMRLDREKQAVYNVSEAAARPRDGPWAGLVGCRPRGRDGGKLAPWWRCHTTTLARSQVVSKRRQRMQRGCHQWRGGQQCLRTLLAPVALPRKALLPLSPADHRGQRPGPARLRDHAAPPGRAR